MESEAKKQGSYVTGIIGAILGGTIATIPWVLVYVYGNVMLSLLAVLIAAGEFYGYKICRGKMEKKLPAIIMILAIIIVTVVTLLVIPALLLAKEGLPVTTQAIKNLYSFGEFSTAIIKDYAISVIFTILGASVVTSSIKKQLADNVSNVTLDFSNNEEQKRLKEEAIKVLKPVFQRYDALHEDSTMTKEEIFAEVEQNSKIYFNCLKNYGIIKKYKGRYYYDESAEKNEKTKSSAGKISFIIATVLIVILVITVVLGGTNSTTLIQNEDVSYEVENGWNILQEYNESSSGWSYYKYINSKPNYNQEATNEIDYSSEPAVIRISYDKKSEDNSRTFSSVQEMKETIEAYINEVLLPDRYGIDTITTKKGYSAVKVKTEYDSDPTEVDYYYYIYNDGKLAYVDGYTFNTKDKEELESTLDSLIDSFAWQY